MLATLNSTLLFGYNKLNFANLSHFNMSLSMTLHSHKFRTARAQ